jgi:hypothetical protein
MANPLPVPLSQSAPDFVLHIQIYARNSQSSEFGDGKRIAAIETARR